MPHDEGVAATMLPARPVGARTRILLWLFPVASFCFAFLLGRAGAIYSPDSFFYRSLALGQQSVVPSPFSARILGPAIAGWLGRVTGLGVDTGFLVFGILCLVVFLSLVLGLLESGIGSRSGLGKPALFAAVFLMPFWVDIFHDYYLPDLIHATILAGLLLCLASGRMTLAMLLLLPAFLARESTVLISLCLVWAAWRRMPERAVAAGCLATVCGALASRHFDSIGPLGQEGLHGGLYALGKVLWSLPRNTIGLELWTNTLSPCGTPIWRTALPSWLSVGRINQAGVCGFSLWGPARLLLAWFGIFGAGPGIAIALRRALFSPDTLWAAGWLVPGQSDGAKSEGREIVFRLSVLYGAVCILLAPALGASVDRLVAYGWPLFFLALAWFLAAHPAAVRARAAWILLMHLIASWVAWLGFRHQTILGYCVAGLIALTLNCVVYSMIDRSSLASLPASTDSPNACPSP